MRKEKDDQVVVVKEMIAYRSKNIYQNSGLLYSSNFELRRALCRPWAPVLLCTRDVTFASVTSQYTHVTGEVGKKTDIAVEWSS